MPRILLVDDKADQIVMSIEEVLDEYELDLAADGPTAVEKAAAADCVLLDIKMPARLADVDEEEGLAVLRQIKEQRPELPVIMLTAYSDVDLVVEAMKLGAYHYVTKPPDVNRLRQLIKAALADAELRRHAESLERTIAVRDELSRPQAVAQRDGLGEIIGRSDIMQPIYEMIERAARVNVPVLILGASGTGKELVARELHRLSPRAGGPFVPVNCAAIPRELLESQLFGHKKGSFTGATDDRLGDFKLADGGTLYLDEIGDMPHELQAKLLRVLQDGTIRPVGADEYTAVDVRIISSTNQDLAARMADGRFRQDLYYRLNVVRVELPPLADRQGDVELLAREFVKQTCERFGVEAKELSAEAVELLRGHDWPGNVRQLQHAIEQAVALGDGAVLEPQDFHLEPPSAEGATQSAGLEETWNDLTTRVAGYDIVSARNKFGEQLLRELIVRAIRQTHEVRAAGELLGFVEPGTEGDKAYDGFRQWLRRLGIRKRDIV